MKSSLDMTSSTSLFPAIALVTVALMAMTGCGESTLQTTGPLAQVQIGPDGNPVVGPDGAPAGPTSVSAGDLSLAVTAPQPGQLITTRKLNVAGTVTGVTQITVNGNPVEVVNDAFTFSLDVAEGLQNINVSSTGLPPVDVPVTVDYSPPVVELISPQRGSFFIQGQQDTIPVQGRAIDKGTGVTEVTVNGQVVPLNPDGTFSTQITPTVGANVIEAIATDGNEKSSSKIHGAIYGQFAPFESITGEAITASIGPAAFAVLGEALVGGLAGGDAGGGLLDGILEGNGALGDFNGFRLVGFSYGEIGIDLVPSNGFFRATISIYNLRIDIEGEQELFGITVPVEGNMKSNPAEISTDLYMDVTAEGGLGIRLENSEPALHNFDLDLDGILDLVDGLLESTVREIVEDSLRDVLQNVVVENLFDPSMLSQTLDIFGMEAQLQLAIDRLNVSPSAVSLALDSNVTMDQSPLAPTSPGVLSTPSQAPADSTGAEGLRFSLSDDFINRFTFALWRGGALNINISELLAGGDMPADGGGGGLGGIELNAATFSLFAGSEILTHAAPDTPVGMRIRSLLPPVSSVDPTGDQPLQLTIADMMLEFYLEPLNKPPVKFATVAMVMDIGLGFALDEEGALAPSFSIDVRTDLAEEPLFDVDDEGFEQIVQSLISGLPDLLAAGGDEMIEGDQEQQMEQAMPGLMLNSIRSVAEGSPAEYLSIYMGLDVQ